MKVNRKFHVTKDTKAFLKKAVCVTLAATLVLSANDVGFYRRTSKVYANENTENSAVIEATQEMRNGEMQNEEGATDKFVTEGEKQTTLEQEKASEVITQISEVDETTELLGVRGAFKAVKDLKIAVTEIKVDKKLEISQLNPVITPADATNTAIKWALFEPGDMGVTIEGKLSDVTALTAKTPGFIWLRASVDKGLKPKNSNPWVNDSEYFKYFKIVVKGQNGEEFSYPAETYKDHLKPLVAPIQFGYFRTWHDYWSEAPWSQSSNHFHHAPAEVDILSVFHAYTEEGNPFWEKLKYEYVPKLNKQGTRVVRTINIRDLDGREGVSRELGADATFEEIAKKAVEKYVDSCNLDGLDVDFEAEHLSGLNFERAKGVILEIGKLIGREGKRKDILFMIDTDLYRHDMFSKEILDKFNYLIRQNYRHDHEGSYDYFKDAITKDRFLTGFSFYEERGNPWREVPSVSLVADEKTNETTMADPDDLLEKSAFRSCNAYKQALYAVKEGYGGLFSYAIDRDGIAHGNNIKFFRKDNGGHPTKYYFSIALKRVMQYHALKEVTDIELNPYINPTVELNLNEAKVIPEDATHKTIEWSIVSEGTTVESSKIKLENGSLTVDEQGIVMLKATVKNGKKGAEEPKIESFEKIFKIYVGNQNIDSVELRKASIVVGEKFNLNDGNYVIVAPGVQVKWMLYHPGETGALKENEKISSKAIDSFTPVAPGYVWLRAEISGKNPKYFKVMVKQDALSEPPSEGYPEAFPKEKMKPLDGPIQLGYFRTWHDYWSWTPEYASHKMSDVPAEVDILAVFHDYTEDGNPFWEKLKNEYVPKLNERGTRVIRTIGIKDVDGRRGVSATFNYAKTPEGYKALAKEIVKEYVTKHNLDGLDIDFELHDDSNNPQEIAQAKAVINELGKLIGRTSTDRSKNMLFMLDTNKDANHSDGIFKATVENYDYVIRQNYGPHNSDSRFSSYKGILPEKRYLTGFSFYEESGNQWGDVPNKTIAANDVTNAPLLDDADKLFDHAEFKNCRAYKQAQWAAKGGYGGIISYAVERDGVRHGNNKKFFRTYEGGKPSSYFFSKALKHLMKYEAHKDVESITLPKTSFMAEYKLPLAAKLMPIDATHKDIVWSIVDNKTDAADAKIEKEYVTAKGPGVITLKATVENGKKGKIPNLIPFETEIKITVKKRIYGVDLNLKETVVGKEVKISDFAEYEQGVSAKWMIYHPGETGVLGDKKITSKEITSFTPTAPGYIWLRAGLNDGRKPRYFKVMVKQDASSEPPSEGYPEAFPKDKMKAFEGPIQFGYFRTWHDYWSWTPDDASNHLGDVPAEVDIVSVFHDYTEDGNPFWEKLKNEYVPKLNRQGTRVVRTIGIKDVDGRRGVSETFDYEKTSEGYKALAKEIVKEYVTKYNLDGLDIDFEYHDTSDWQWRYTQKQAKAVIDEIGKIIGLTSQTRGKNMVFILDTNRSAGESDRFFESVKDNFDYVVRQNYGANDLDGRFSSYKNILPKERYLTGFSYYEEKDNNKWGDVPSVQTAADENTNAPVIADADELFKDTNFTSCRAYKQAKWVAEGGYGGVFSYAIDRDGVRHGNDTKFFKKSEGGKPTSYFYSKALKHLMQYKTARQVQDITLSEKIYDATKPIDLNEKMTIEPAELKDNVIWSIVESTVKDAEIENGILKVKRSGQITVKATVENGKKLEIPKVQNFEKEFKITVLFPVLNYPEDYEEPATENPKKPESGKKNEGKPEEKKPEEVDVEDPKTPQGSIETSTTTGELVRNKITYKLNKKKKIADVKAVVDKAAIVKIGDVIKRDGMVYKILSLMAKAMKGNKHLKKLVLGKHVTRIGKDCFKGCVNFQILEIKASKIKSIGKDAFKGVNKKFTVIVPKKMNKKERKRLFKMLKKAGVEAKIIKK